MVIPTELHLKYRPKRLDMLAGQDDVAHSIEVALRDKRGRSFLLTGGSGVGKTSLARIIATMVGGDGPNYYEVDAATRTGIDDVRDLQERAVYRPVLGGAARVICLDEAHMLTRAAWNALLKVIEEPPSHLYWIFCTTEPAKVPDAVLTRCLRYDLAPILPEVLQDLLSQVAAREGKAMASEVLAACVERADGSARDALVALAQVWEAQDVEEARRLLRQPGESPEVIDLCRAINGQQPYHQLLRLVGRLDAPDPESVRRVVFAYFSKVALGNVWAIRVLRAFAAPYPKDPGIGYLLLSLYEATLDVPGVSFTQDVGP